MTRQHNRHLWTQRLQRYRLSGQTIVEFCSNEEVSQATFYYWKKRLGDLESSSSEELSTSAAPTLRSNANPQFAQVALPCIARLTNGIQIGLGTDPAQVRRIVTQLLEYAAEAASDASTTSEIGEASSC